MKRSLIFFLLVITSLFLSFSQNAFAETSIKVVPKSNSFITIEEAFNEISSHLDGVIPESYKYIQLNISGASVGSDYYQSLQKFVYLDVLPNKNINLLGTKSLTAHNFYNLIEKTYQVKLIKESQVDSLKLRKANESDILNLRKIFLDTKDNTDTEEVPIEKIEFSNKESSSALKAKQKIFTSVYDTLRNSHYDKNDITDIKLVESATQGLAKGSGDKYTTFFPPAENKNFMETLDGKFEGIGSYVEMEEAGILKIISPISGSPSEKAGLRGGDRVTHADGKEILSTTSIQEAISWIKGPKGTTVVLTIKRGKETLEISVVRDTIIVKSVEHKKLSSQIYYIKIISFGDDVSKEFKEALEGVKATKSIKKIIIDVRNNPGGYLDQVSDMLSYLVPKNEKTVVVKYLSGNKDYKSRGYDYIDFSKYKIVILQNEGSASASEIMAGTIKDYYPNATILGKKSYGKGSVQTIKSYSDGSSLKYTIAKWFTGKTETGIDGKGINVDIEVDYDFEKFTKTQIDTQLEKAKNFR